MITTVRKDGHISYEFMVEFDGQKVNVGHTYVNYNLAYQDHVYTELAKVFTKALDEIRDCYTYANRPMFDNSDKTGIELGKQSINDYINAVDFLCAYGSISVHAMDVFIQPIQYIDTELWDQYLNS